MGRYLVYFVEIIDKGMPGKMISQCIKGRVNKKWSILLKI